MIKILQKQFGNRRNEIIKGHGGKEGLITSPRRDFKIIAIKDGETTNEYFARTPAIANKMKIHGEKLQERAVVEIHRSMTMKFNYVVCDIEESNNVKTLSIDELQSSLLVQEQKMKIHKEEKHVLQVSNGGRTGSRGRGCAVRGGCGKGRQSF